MIELCVQPVIGAMAVVAGRGEGGGDVIRIVRCLKIRRVTGVTVSGHCLKLAIGGALVAGVAVDGCMRPSEREAIVMLLYLLDRNRAIPVPCDTARNSLRVAACEYRRGNPGNAGPRW